MNTQEQTKKYQVYISTDGKMTVVFQADHEVEVLATLNALTSKGVYEKLISMAKEANPKVGSSRPSFKQPPAVNEALGKCPQCGAGLVEGTTKTGKKLIKCSTQSYNFQTKRSEGCSYIQWL